MPDLEHVKYAITDAPVADIILRRWSPRAFADKPVSSADLKTLFTAATWAASSQNEQPWRFILGIKSGTGAEPSETYTKLFNALVPGNQVWAKSAPVLYASILPRRPRQPSRQLQTHRATAPRPQTSRGSPLQRLGQASQPVSWPKL